MRPTDFSRPSVPGSVVVLLLLLLLGGSFRPALCKTRRPPNVVFVITDDQRWDSLGVTGHPFAQTPNIDRLAREGVRFRNFFATTPLCSPSRASFLTGQYARRHRVVNNDRLGQDVISHTLETFPRRLREAGYETAFVGKWHMGFDDSRRPGFDYWFSFKGQGAYFDPVVNDNGRQLQLDGHMTDLLNSRAVEFVNSRRGMKPFLLYLSHKALHVPYLPAKRHERLYGGARYVPPASADEDLTGKPVLRRVTEPVDWASVVGVAPEPPESRRGRGRDRDSVVRDQLRTLAGVDEGVGQLIQALRRRGQLDNTVFIFTSDNGYLLGEHGQFDNKRFAYEESIRVPFIVRYPRLVAAGSNVDALALNIDLAPTLVELAGAEPLAEAQGRSLVPLLRQRGAKPEWRTSFLAEYFLEKVAPRTPSWQAVRTQGWKYIRYVEHEGMDELYDLRADPQETRNLVNDPTAREDLARMREELARLNQETK